MGELLRCSSRHETQANSVLICFGTCGLYVSCVDRLNAHTEMMAEHLAQYFMDLPNMALTAHRVPTLALDHRERGFHVGALVIMGEELLPILHDVVIHLSPDCVFLRDCRMGFEGDMRHCLDKICLTFGADSTTLRASGG